MRRFFAFARCYCYSEFLGLRELHLKKPALLVGNHTIFVLTDAPLMIERLYTQYGVMLHQYPQIEIILHATVGDAKR